MFLEWKKFNMNGLVFGMNGFESEIFYDII